jgi:hypothetical protein
MKDGSNSTKNKDSSKTIFKQASKEEDEDFDPLKGEVESYKEMLSQGMIDQSEFDFMKGLQNRMLL